MRLLWIFLLAFVSACSARSIPVPAPETKDATVVVEPPPPTVPGRLLGANGNFAFPIGPASLSGFDAGTYPNPIIPEGSQGTFYPGSVSNLVDQNSLIWGDVTQPEWQGVSCYLTGPTGTPQLIGGAGQSPDGSQDAVWVNEGAVSSGVLALSHDAFVPTGVTSFNFEIDVMNAPGGSAVSVPMIILNSNSGCGGNGAIATSNTSTCVTTNSWQTCRLASGTVAHGTAYTVQIPLNYSTLGTAGATFLIARARIVPTGSISPPLFRSPESSPAGSFYRYEASPVLWDNIHSDFVGVGGVGGVGLAPFRQYLFQSPFARMVFQSNGQTQVGLEVLNAGLTSTPNQQVGVNVNGRPYASFVGATSPMVEDATTLTLPSGNNEIEFVGGEQGYIGLGIYPESAGISGEFVRAAYSTTPLTVLPPPKPSRTVVVWGDSKEAGIWSTNPPAQGFPVLLRQMLGGQTSTVIEAVGSSTLNNDTSTPALITQLAQRMARARPDILLSVIGRNDWADSTMTPTVFTATLEAAWDAIHAATPSTQIVAVTWWLESVAQESSTISGFTLANFRAAEQNACTARPTYCVFMNASTGIPNWNQASGAGSSLYTDGVHPSNYGSGQAASYVGLQVSHLLPASSSLQSWYPAETAQTCLVQAQNVAAGSHDLCIYATDQANVIYYGDQYNNGVYINSSASVTLGIPGADALTLVRGTGGGTLEFTGNIFQFSNVAASANAIVNQSQPITDIPATPLTVQAQGASTGAVTNVVGGVTQVLAGQGTTPANNGGILLGYGLQTAPTPFFSYGTGGNGWIPQTSSQSLATTPVTLTSTELLTPYVIYTGALSANPTVVNLPNVAGMWFMDISAVTNTTGNAIEFVSGSANCSTIPGALTVANDLVIVHTTGANGITCGLL
jgi:lysophospholipase L1-like esterase